MLSTKLSKRATVLMDKMTAQNISIKEPLEGDRWWLAPSPHSESVPDSTPSWGLPVGSLHVLPVYAWVLSGFLPTSKNMHVRSIGVSKLSLGVSVPRLSLCGPVMD